MTFLNPAILFGLLAASIPILIHLLNLRKLKKIEFSTLIFLKELQKNKIRKIKIKQLLLLLIRILIILFLVMAFARPTLKGIAIGGTASTAKTSAVFIVDNSLSMGIVDSKGSFLNQSKEVILKIFEQFEEGDEVVFLFTGENYQDEYKFSSNISELKKEINDINISSVSNSLNYMLVKAAELIGSSQNYNKEIYLFSDFQKSRLADEKVLSDLSQFFNENVKLYLFEYSKSNPQNYSIDDFSINSQIFEKNKLLKTAAVVKNNSSSDVNNLVVSLFINGKRMAQKSIMLNSGESKEIELESIIAEYGYQDIFVEIEDDEIPGDNRRYASIYVADVFNTLILSDDKQDSKFISLALQTANENQAIKIDERNITQLSSIDLNKYSSVFIVGFDKIEQTDNMKNYVEQGGGVILFPGSKSSIGELNNKLLSLSINQFKSYIETAKQGAPPILFRNIDFEHPIFSDLFIDKKNQKIESPEIISYYSSSNNNGRVIIDLFDQSPFLSEHKIGNGKILLCSVVPNHTASDLGFKGIFVPLVYKSMLYLSSQVKDNIKYTAGQKVEIPLKSFINKPMRVIYPDNSEESLTIKSSETANYLSFASTNQSGLYKFKSDELIKEVVAVNHDARESVTEYLSKTEIENYLKEVNFKGAHSFVDVESDIATVIQQARYGSELWKLFLVLALLTVIAEMIISRNTKKEMANVTEN